jgi:hypothetical protein
MNHIMLDLETLGTRPSSIVVSIGATRFDPNSGATGGRFYAVPNRIEQRMAKRTEENETLAWWARQEPEAQRVLVEDQEPVTDALWRLARFIGPGVQGVWGNGAAFDNAILASLYQTFDLEVPWPFWIDRCFRTLKAIGKANDVKPPPFLGTPHNALDDALHQAAHLQRIVLAANVRI